MDQPPTAGVLSVAAVTRALRTVRPGCYQIDAAEGGQLTLTLVMQASAAGRRNAAVRIIDALAREGISLADADPVEALTQPGCGLLLRRDGGGASGGDPR